MIVINPQLPIKEGYVEIEVDGKRVYQLTPETAEKQKTESTINELIAIIVDYEYRLTLLEV